MATPVQLRNPPIKEALFDIRLVEAPQVVERLERLRPLVEDRYPDIRPLHRKEARIDLSSGQLASETRDLGAIGLMCHAADGKSVAQFRSNGFTLNWLDHYTSAADLYAEAIRLWQIFVEAAAIQPHSVNRLGLRYINRFTLPLAHGDRLDRFLVVSPQIPASLPQSVAEFVTRIRVIGENGDPALVLTQKLGASATGDSPEMILDLDASSETGLGSDESKLRPKFEALRDLKNKGFFSVLQDDAVKLFT